MHYGTRVARLGDMAPIGLLLAAVGDLKLGFGRCLVPYLLIFGSFSNHWRVETALSIEIGRFWATFFQCLAP